jgi:hypothetical protein
MSPILRAGFLFLLKLPRDDAPEVDPDDHRDDLLSASASSGSRSARYTRCSPDCPITNGRPPGPKLAMHLRGSTAPTDSSAPCEMLVIAANR